MTNQIETIMALADAYAKAYADCTYTEREDLKQALEAALKPGTTVHSHSVKVLPNGDTEGFAFVTSKMIGVNDE